MKKINIQLVVIIAGAICSLVVVAMLAFKVVRHVVIENNEVLVHSVAQSLMPALLLNDMQQIDAAIKVLESYPGVQTAELVSSQGVSIASYARAGQSFDPTSASFELASVKDDPNQVYLMAPITFDSLIVANLHIAVNLWPAYLRIVTWLGLLLIFTSVIYVLLKRLRIKLRFESVGDVGNDNDFDLRHAIDKAMRDAEISIEYQPIQRMSDGGVFGMEVVICWHHPSGQTFHVNPVDFVILAERNGICLPFDDWLWATACKQASSWQYQYGPLILTINISASQFQDPAFARKIRDICEENLYPHQLLELEVHESVLSHQLENAKLRIQSFADQELSVTVDHFGLQLNSVDLLELLPITKVKLDSKLVNRMQIDVQVSDLIQTLVMRAGLHEIQVMANGLERVEQRHELQTMGCILGQGTYFERPLSSGEFEEFLKQRSVNITANQLLNVDNNLGYQA